MALCGALLACAPDCPVERPTATVAIGLGGMAAEVDAPERARVTVRDDRAELRGDEQLWMHIARGSRDVIATAERMHVGHPGVRVTYVQARGSKAIEFRLGKRQHHFVSTHAEDGFAWSCWSDGRGRFSEVAVQRMQEICASVRTVAR